MTTRTRTIAKKVGGLLLGLVIAAVFLAPAIFGVDAGGHCYSAIQGCDPGPERAADYDYYDGR